MLFIVCSYGIIFKQPILVHAILFVIIMFLTYDVVDVTTMEGNENEQITIKMSGIGNIMKQLTSNSDTDNVVTPKIVVSENNAKISNSNIQIPSAPTPAPAPAPAPTPAYVVPPSTASHIEPTPATATAPAPAPTPAPTPAPSLPTIKNGDFSQPPITKNTYKYLTSDTTTVPGWNFSSVLLNQSNAWGYPMPYPNGEQCVSIQKTQELSTNDKMIFTPGITYSISFHACGRNCCDKSGIGNPINIGLEGKTFYSFTPPVSVWTKYSAKFTSSSSVGQIISFKGTWTTTDRSSAIQGISLQIIDDTSATYVSPFKDVAVNDTVSCAKNDPMGFGAGAAYRYGGNDVIQYYPTPPIATTWNKDWSKNIINIPDCSKATVGTPKILGMKPAA